MKKQGYTLIEVITVLSIMIVLIGGGATIVSSLKHIKNDVEVENVVYEIYNILSYAKSYCRRNLCDGKIIIDMQKNSVLFRYREYDNGYRDVTVRNEKFPSNIKISSNFKSGTINVSELGYLKNSGTILIKYGKKYKEISIAVGNDITNIKDEKEQIDEIN